MTFFEKMALFDWQGYPQNLYPTKLSDQLWTFSCFLFFFKLVTLFCCFSTKVDFHWHFCMKGHFKLRLHLTIPLNINPEAEFKEFKSRLKSAKTRFKLSAGLDLETFYTILSETTIIKPRLKFFKFGLRCRELMDWLIYKTLKNSFQ